MSKPFRYSFDSKCLELAEHFLPSHATDAVKKELAQVIQDAVENFVAPGDCPTCAANGKPHFGWCSWKDYGAQDAPQNRVANLNKGVR